MQSISALKTKVIKPRQIEDKNEEIKLTMKMLGLICLGTATQTLQDAAKAAKKQVYEEHLAVEYDIDSVQQEVLIEDEGAFFEFISRDFTELEEGFESSEAFTAHLFQTFFQIFWNHLHAVMFGADAYRAYKIQKDYLMTRIVKPLDVGVEAAFQRIDCLTNLLLLPPSHRKSG